MTETKFRWTRKIRGLDKDRIVHPPSASDFVRLFEHPSSARDDGRDCRVSDASKFEGSGMNRMNDASGK
jgi:hypothetical protein